MRGDQEADAVELIIEKLVEYGFDRADLPGPGDLLDAIHTLGFRIEKETA
jgi:hypothetical protein